MKNIKKCVVTYTSTIILLNPLIVKCSSRVYTKNAMKFHKKNIE